MKIIKASDEQKSKYEGFHPLYGYIMDYALNKENNFPIIIESLQEDTWKLEALAPKGFHFSPDNCHTILARNESELIRRLECFDLETCDEFCDDA